MLFRVVFMAVLLSFSAFTFAGSNSLVSEEEMDLAKKQMREASQSLSEGWKEGSSSFEAGNYYNFQNLPVPNKTRIPTVQDTARLWEDYRSTLSVLKPDFKVKVFISFSMPKETWKRYIEEADKLGRRNIVFVIRGFDKSQKMSKTSFHILNFTKGHNVEVQINPVDFDTYGINKVPALIVYKDSPLLKNVCSKKTIDHKELNKTFKGVYGDVSIEYALSYLSSQSDIEPSMKDSIAGFVDALHPGL